MPPFDPSVSTPTPGSLQPEDSPINGGLVSAAPGTPPIGSLEPQSSPNPTGIVNPTMSAQDLTAPPAPNRPWRNILQGALWGLSGAAQKGPGRGGFGAGVGMGVRGAQEGQAQQASLQFASVKAGDDHIRAMKEAQLADLQTDEAKLGLQMQYQNIAALNKLFNIQPDGSISAQTPQDMHAKAAGALQTSAAASPDGKLHQVQTVNSPAGGNQKEHIIDYFNPPSAQDLQQNPTGFHDLVAEGFKADGKVLTDQMWETANGAVKPGEKPNAIGMLAQQQAGQAQMVQDTYKRLYSPFGGKEVVTTGARTPDQIVSMNAGSSAALRQQADAYDKMPDPNPTVSKLLHNQATNFDFEVERQRANASGAKSTTTTENAPAEAAAAGKKTTAEEAAKFDPTTPAGLLNVQKAQQDLIDKKYSNQDKFTKTLSDEGAATDPTTGKQVTLNLLNAPPEALVDQRTGQPIANKQLSTMKPTQQESNRADFAKSVLHILDVVDKQRAAGTAPNGPLKGRTAKELAAMGLGDEKSQQVINELSLGVSAATGAHVGGRFNEEIMKKMDTLMNLNMNDSQLTGAEEGIRTVMTPYATNGGRMSVSEYTQTPMGQMKVAQIKGTLKTASAPGKPPLMSVDGGQTWQPMPTAQ